MKVQFDIKYRPQIESGEYKVETNEGDSVRIVCWDAKRKYGDCICGFMGEEEDKPYFWRPDGSWWADHTQSPYDLFIVTPEPELTEFEQSVRDCIIENLTSHGREMSSTVFIDDETTKKLASELFGLARNQLQIEGLVTMEHLNKACEAEYQSGLADGKNEALKDLPRWEKDSSIKAEQHITVGKNGERFHYNGYSLLIPSLVKLPGFKED